MDLIKKFYKVVGTYSYLIKKKISMIILGIQKLKKKKTKFTVAANTYVF